YVVDRPEVSAVRVDVADTEIGKWIPFALRALGPKPRAEFHRLRDRRAAEERGRQIQGSRNMVSEPVLGARSGTERRPRRDQPAREARRLDVADERIALHRESQPFVRELVGDRRRLRRQRSRSRRAPSSGERNALRAQAGWQQQRDDRDDRMNTHHGLTDNVLHPRGKLLWTS